MNSLKKIFTLTTIVAILSGTAKGQETQTKAQAASEKASTLYGVLDNSTVNKNMFAGMNNGNKPMNQSYLELGTKNIFLSTWMNYDLKEKKSVEVDYNAGFKTSIDIGKNAKLNIQPGFTYYIFPNQDFFKDYQEINCKLSTTGLPVDFSARAAKLFGEGINPKDAWDGIMVDFVASKSTPIFNNFTATESVEAIYSGNYTTGKRGFSHGTANLTLTYSPLENLSINATATYQQRIDEKFATPAADTFFKTIINSEPYFRVGVNYTFK